MYKRVCQKVSFSSKLKLLTGVLHEINQFRPLIDSILFLSNLLVRTKFDSYGFSLRLDLEINQLEIMLIHLTFTFTLPVLSFHLHSFYII